MAIERVRLQGSPKSPSESIARHCQTAGLSEGDDDDDVRRSFPVSVVAVVAVAVAARCARDPLLNLLVLRETWYLSM